MMIFFDNFNISTGKQQMSFSWQIIDDDRYPCSEPFICRTQQHFNLFIARQIDKLNLNIYYTLESMSEYTESQAYKHLLEVAENIIYSSEVDEEILRKYQELKISITKKIPKISDTYYLNLLSTYRLLVDNAVKIVQSFQEELQTEMERTSYTSLVLALNNGFQDKLAELEESVETNNSSKTRLMHKEEINTLRYQYDQLDSKFQNLGLLIEVHKKMHQIILQATKTEQKRQSVEQNYKEKIKLLENSISSVSDTKLFLDQHRLTEEKYSEFKLASKTLKKVLFAQFS